MGRAFFILSTKAGTILEIFLEIFQNRINITLYLYSSLKKEYCGDSVASLSKRYSVGMDGEGKWRKDQLNLYIQSQCVYVVAFVFLI